LGRQSFLGAETLETTISKNRANESWKKTAALTTMFNNQIEQTTK